MKIKKYLFVVLAPVIAGIIQYYLWNYLSPFVWFLFFPTVFFAARFAGLWGGIISATVSTFIVLYLFIPPQFSWHIDNLDNLYSVIIFLFMGYLFGDSQEKLKNSTAKLEILLKKSHQKNEEIIHLYEQNLALDDIKFYQLANSLPQIVWATTPAGKNIFFNRQWYEYTGMGIDESAGDGWNKPFHPDDRNRSWNAWQNAVNNNGEYSLECRLRRADGQYRWWLIRGIPVFNTNHDIYKWFGTCTDIHEIKLVQEALAASQAKMSAALHSMRDAVFIVDSKGNYIDFNEAFITFHRFQSRNECLKSIKEFSLVFEMYDLQGLLLKQDDWIVPRALRSEVGVDAEFTLKKKNTGEVFIGSYSYAPIFNALGEIDGCVITARDITAQKNAEAQLKSYLYRLEHAMEDTLFVLTKAVDMRDPYTSGHQQRVGKIAEEIGKKLQLSSKQSHNLNLIGLIHDIGKIGIPAELLSKPTKLSQIEYDLIKTHVNIGYEILKSVNFLIPVAEVIHEHHERFDGSGYPQGLKGEQILFEARIIAVADVIEAMTNHRPYRSALGIEKALEEIEGGRGTKYDPQVVDACLDLFRKDGYLVPEKLDSSRILSH